VLTVRHWPQCGVRVALESRPTFVYCAAAALCSESSIP